MEEHTLSPMQEKLLAMFKDTVSFFEQYNLRYFVCGGTLLGTVRHHGFIPWDDDIDVYMYREDYERLFTLNDEIERKGYYIQSLSEDGYYLSFAKIVDKSSTIWEKERFEHLTGVYIDVFPIDRFSYDDNAMVRNQIKARKLFRRYQTTISKNATKRMLKYLCQFRFVTFWIALRSKFSDTAKKQYLQMFLDFEKSFTDNKGDKCVSLTTAKGCIFRCEWFDKMTDGIFETLDIKIPSGWHEYLTLLYGDYMTPPPKEKQVSVHHSIYVNLCERISLQEVKKRLKKENSR
ncbi:MAG: LicD family protein [Bacteroidales bacterium]|nr:LicD family protein [Bacteroidales bacterium]